MDDMGNVVRLASVREPLALSIEELRTTDFQACPQFVDFATRIDLREDHEAKLRHMGLASRCAMAILSIPKAGVVDLIETMEADSRENSDDFFQVLTTGRKLTSAILDMITAAEARVAVAMASN